MPVPGKSKKEIVTEFRTAVRLQRRWDTSTGWVKLRLFPWFTAQPAL